MTSRVGVKAAFDVGPGNSERQREIDLALAVMCALQKPGQEVSCMAIAEVTGMSHGGPAFIVPNALKKIRAKLSRGEAAVFAKELRA